MEKKNTGLKVLVIILSLLVVALGAFVIYDKFINNENDTINNEETKIVDEKIKQAIIDYFEIFKSAGSFDKPLIDLQLMKANQNNNFELTSDGYIKTDISYSKFINTIKNYMTEEWFNNEINKLDIYKEQDGLLCYDNGGTSGADFEVGNITLKNNESGSRYIADLYEYDLENNKNYIGAIEFDVTKYNDKYVISYCNY